MEEKIATKYKIQKWFIFATISLILAVVLQIGLANALSKQVQIGGVVEPSFLKISGKLVSFSTKNNLYEYAHVPFEVNFQNTGDTTLRPEGNIVIKNYLNKEVGSIAVNQYGIASLPGKNQTYYPQWDREDNLGLGQYTANLVLNYDTNEIINAKLNFWIFPWRMVSFIIIYLLLVYILNNLFWHYHLVINAKGWGAVHGGRGI